MSTAQVYFSENHYSLRNADHLWHLQQTGLAEGLSLSETHLLASACTDLIFDKAQTLFRLGDPADALYFVNRGTVRLLVTTSEGRQKIVGMLSTGEIFGEEVLGPSKTYQVQAVAHEETWISILRRDKLMKLLTQIPKLSMNLVRFQNERLLEARNEIETLSFSGTEERIAKALLKLSKKHGKRIASATTLKKLKIAMSHEHLAQMIGANRPHVSAIMSQFKKKGWIQYQKRKLLINVPELLSFVGTEVHA